MGHGSPRLILLIVSQDVCLETSDCLGSLFSSPTPPWKFQHVLYWPVFSSRTRAGFAGACNMDSRHQAQCFHDGHLHCQLPSLIVSWSLGLVRQAAAPSVSKELSNYIYEQHVEHVVFTWFSKAFQPDSRLIQARSATHLLSRQRDLALAR